MAQRSVRFHPHAEDEANRAYEWYSERNPASARAFLADLDHAVSRVQESPERWPSYHGTARRYIFQRFPFAKDPNCPKVLLSKPLCVWHTSIAYAALSW